tara:strand:+ start:1778 stop:2491 length:714 start_codon:yes stop_codon:yes gene_type:complete
VQQAEFDLFANDYAVQHQASIKLSGEEPDFFARAKIEAAKAQCTAVGLAPKSMLDFGAGIGNAVAHLQEAFPRANLACLDVSEESLSVCRQRTIRPAEILPYNGKEIPCKDDSFDFVFTACVFHHIDEIDHIALLREIRRVLSPNGRFMLFEHNPWNPLTQHAVRNCPFDENAVLIAAPEMRRRLIKCGFGTIKTDYRTFFPAPLAALRPLERFLGWLPIGAQYSLFASGEASDHAR